MVRARGRIGGRRHGGGLGSGTVGPDNWLDIRRHHALDYRRSVVPRLVRRDPQLAVVLLRGLARLFRFKRLSVALRTWRTRYLSLPVAALWLSLGWVVFPDSPAAAVESTTTGALVILVFMVAGAVFGAVRGRRPHRRWLPAVLGLLPVFAVAAWLLWPGPGTVLSLRPEERAPPTAT